MNNQIQDAFSEMLSGKKSVNQGGESGNDVVVDITGPVVGPETVLQADTENVVINEVVVSEVNKPECSICGQMMKNKKTLKQHIKTCRKCS